MLATLIWKDFRLVRLILGLSLAALITAVPFNIALIFLFRPDVLSDISPMVLVAGSFEGATAFLPVVCYIAVILTAGSILAGERQERTADFLATLPPSRTKTILSKGIVVASTIAAWTLIYVAMMGFTQLLGQFNHHSLQLSDLPPGYFIAQVIIGGGGIAWAASAFCRTITPPVLAGIIIPALFVPAMQTVLHKMNVSIPPSELAQWTVGAIFMLGLLGFILGTIVYLRRESP